MMALENTKPTMFNRLSDGESCVQRSSKTTFSQVPVDQAIEQTMNCHSKSSGGIIYEIQILWCVSPAPTSFKLGTSLASQDSLQRELMTYLMGELPEREKLTTKKMLVKESI